MNLEDYHWSVMENDDGSISFVKWSKGSAVPLGTICGKIDLSYEGGRQRFIDMLAANPQRKIRGQASWEIARETGLR